MCDERGKHFSTENFAERIKNVFNNSENIIFIIGGSYGIDIPTVTQKFSNITLLKLSEMVLPHSLAFLVLMEQIYRSFEIMK